MTRKNHAADPGAEARTRIVREIPMKAEVSSENNHTNGANTSATDVLAVVSEAVHRLSLPPRCIVTVGSHWRFV